MELRPLTIDELRVLYHGQMTGDFPPEELKPLFAMKHMYAQNRYRPLVMTDGGTQKGYAMIWLDRSGRYALLDYLAVLRGMRGTGLGSALLKLLQEPFPSLLCETEVPEETDDPEEREVRKRRIRFYLRSGFRVLNYDCALFGVRYHVLYRGPETDDAALLRQHQAIYDDRLTSWLLARYLQIPLRPGEAVRTPAAWKKEGRV